jgi:hypothetical protein
VQLITPTPDRLAERLRNQATGSLWTPRRIAILAFAGSLAVRLVRLPDTHFARDQAVALWMALDAVRQGSLPDHGLVASYLAFEPPGLQWLMMPAVLVGGGQPVAVMTWFALLASAGVSVLVWTVARYYGTRLALILGALLATNPADALAPALLWHVSLYVPAVSLMLAAATHLALGGSARWALVLGAVPFFYSLIHYVGLLLAPIAVLLVPHSRWRVISRPLACGALVGLFAWLPFLRFESSRNWSDLRIVLFSPGLGPDPTAASADRLEALVMAVQAWGTGRWIEPGRVSLLLLVLGVAGLAYALCRRERLSVLAGLVLALGTLMQAAAGMGLRSDITMLWNTPLLVLAASALARMPMQLVARGVLGLLVAGNAYLVNKTHDEMLVRGDSLAHNWARAEMGDRWMRSAEDMARTPPEAAVYLPNDPPVVAGTGSEVWYLRDLLEPSAGRRAAASDHDAAQHQ